MPLVIGFLFLAGAGARPVCAVSGGIPRRGCATAGLRFEGRDVRIEYRWARRANFEQIAERWSRDLIGPEGRFDRRKRRRSCGTRCKKRYIHHTDRLQHAPDPVGNGYVASLAQPGGNATGYMISNTIWHQVG